MPPERKVVEMLNENYDSLRKDGILITYPVASKATVYKGALVCLDEKGWLVPGQENDYAFVGVSYEKADNAKGENGDIAARVWKVGTYAYDAEWQVSQADVGKEVVIIDDHTVGLKSEYQGLPVAGTVLNIYEYESGSNRLMEPCQVRIKIDLHVK